MWGGHRRAGGVRSGTTVAADTTDEAQMDAAVTAASTSSDVSTASCRGRSRIRQISAPALGRVVGEVDEGPRCEPPRYAGRRPRRRAGDGGPGRRRDRHGRRPRWPESSPASARWRTERARRRIIQVTRVLALEFARDQVRVNAVAPGTTRTRSSTGRPDMDGSAVGCRSAVALPEDQAAGVAFLLSPLSRGPTARQVLFVDGGESMI